MRGARAKEMRRVAYGDLSLKIPRIMEKFITTFRYLNKIDAISGKPVEIRKTSLFNKPRTPRAIYQLMKRAYKTSRMLHA